MLDVESGRIAYAVLSLTRHAGIPVKHVSVPWSALKANKQVDQGEHESHARNGPPMRLKAP